jgi:hypothetical protein
VFLSKTPSELLDRGGAFERVALCLAPNTISMGMTQGSTFPVDEPLMTTEDISAIEDPAVPNFPFKALSFLPNVFIKAFLAGREHLASRGPVGALRFAAEA